MCREQGLAAGARSPAEGMGDELQRIEMFEIRGETKRHFGAFGLARAARGTAHPTVVSGVAPSLGAPHKHTHTRLV